MSFGDVLGFVILVVVGLVPLWFAWTTRRRWLRPLLALFAMLSLWFCGFGFVMGASADQLQGTNIDLIMLILGGICVLGGFGALILALTPVAKHRDDR